MTVDAIETQGSEAASLWFGEALLDQGWARDVRLSIRDGKVAAIETGAPPRTGEAIHAVGLPGLANLHSHAFQRAMAGLTEVRGRQGDSFWTWREIMYRFVDRLTPDQVSAIAAMSFAEMLEGGFTRVGEFHYLHHDVDGSPYGELGEMAQAIAGAAAEAAIGLTLLPVFYAHSGFGGAEPGHGQRRFLNGLDRYEQLLAASREAVRGLPDALVGVAPHSLRAVTLDELKAVTAMTDGPIHIHIAEQVKEVDDCLAWSGARPVDLLFDAVAVDARWCLVHATHLSRGELSRLAASGGAAGLCPITEANLGDGVFPAADYLAAGGVLGVGSDSNVLIDAAQELRMLEYSQRLTVRARNVMADGPGVSCGGSLYRQALAGGARATGVAVGGLRLGAPADIVSLKADGESRVRPTGDQWLDDWIFAARDRRVADVWRRGRRVVIDGEHVAGAAIRRRYRQVLFQVLGGDPS